jgi:hypothetical protein
MKGMKFHAVVLTDTDQVIIAIPTGLAQVYERKQEAVKAFKLLAPAVQRLARVKPVYIIMKSDMGTFV